MLSILEKELDPDPRLAKNKLNPNFDRMAEYPNGHKARMPDEYRCPKSYPDRAQYAFKSIPFADWEQQLIDEHKLITLSNASQSCAEEDPKNTIKKDIYKVKIHTRNFCESYYKLEAPSVKLNVYHSRLRTDLTIYLENDKTYDSCSAPLKAYLNWELKQRLINRNTQIEYKFSVENINNIVEKNIKLNEMNKLLIADNERLHSERKDLKHKIRLLKWSANGRKKILTKLMKVIHYGNNQGVDNCSDGCWSGEFIDTLEMPKWFTEEEDYESDDSLDDWALSELP